MAAAMMAAKRVSQRGATSSPSLDFWAVKYTSGRTANGS